MEMPPMPRPTFYMFKCEQGAPPGIPKPSCVSEDNKDLFNYLAQTMMQKGLMGPVQVIKTSCLGRCKMGPVMLVEPGHHMYCQLSKEKIDRIIQEHIIGQKPVSEFLIPKQFWAEPINLAQ